MPHDRQHKSIFVAMFLLRYKTKMHKARVTQQASWKVGSRCTESDWNEWSEMKPSVSSKADVTGVLKRNEWSYLKDIGGYRDESTVQQARNVTNPKPDRAK